MQIKASEIEEGDVLMYEEYDRVGAITDAMTSTVFPGFVGIVTSLGSLYIDKDTLIEVSRLNDTR